MRIAVSFWLLLIATAKAGLAADLDDRRVKEWIAVSVSDFSDDLDAAVESQRPVVTLEEGWRELKRCRDTGLSLDLNLAAAEHFMFMRLVASKNGDTGYARLPKWYETVKTMAVRAELETLIQTSSQPVSPPDARVTAWGERGVARGLQDYRLHEGQEPTETGDSLKAVFGLTYYVHYYNPLGMQNVLGGTCAVFPPPRGTWTSTDADHRWKLVFRREEPTWTERNTSGAENARMAKLRPGGRLGVYKITRDNDLDVLKFLGFSDAIRSAILALSPLPSFMILTVDGNALKGDWNGLLVIKDSQGQLREMKQPGETPAKTYTFTWQ